MIPNLENILKEWSYRVGVIKTDDESHLFQLHRILVNEGWPLGAINEVISNLTEVDYKYIRPVIIRKKEEAVEAYQLNDLEIILDKDAF